MVELSHLGNCFECFFFVWGGVQEAAGEEMRQKNKVRLYKDPPTWSHVLLSSD